MKHSQCPQACFFKRRPYDIITTNSNRPVDVTWSLRKMMNSDENKYNSYWACTSALTSRQICWDEDCDMGENSRKKQKSRTSWEHFVSWQHYLQWHYIVTTIFSNIAVLWIQLYRVAMASWVSGKGILVNTSWVSLLPTAWFSGGLWPTYCLVSLSLSVLVHLHKW